VGCSRAKREFTFANDCLGEGILLPLAISAVRRRPAGSARISVPHVEILLNVERLYRCALICCALIRVSSASAMLSP